MNNARLPRACDRRALCRSGRVVAAAAVAALLVAGCATGPANPDDPLEGYNRAVFAFNERLDKAVIKPAAQAYDAVAPLPVRTGVGNFFGNIGDLWIGGNNLLQGKLVDGLSDLGRVLINSTVGILGTFDVASEMGLAKHDEDFGQTLGRWGVGEGAYFVVPFFGPRTVRDAAALPVDLYVDPVRQVERIPVRNSLTGLRVVHLRASVLGVDRTLEEGTLDKYVYVRDFYLQQRRYKVYDGNPPSRYENFDDEAAAPLGGPYAVDGLARAAVRDLALLQAGTSVARVSDDNRDNPHR